MTNAQMTKPRQQKPGLKVEMSSKASRGRFFFIIRVLEFVIDSGIRVSEFGI